VTLLVVLVGAKILLITEINHNPFQYMSVTEVCFWRLQFLSINKLQIQFVLCW